MQSDHAAEQGEHGVDITIFPLCPRLAIFVKLTGFQIISLLFVLKIMVNYSVFSKNQAKTAKNEELSLTLYARMIC